MTKFILVTLAFLTLYSDFVQSQSLTGVSGLVTIPSAEVMRDGEFSIGVNYSPREILRDNSFDYNSLLIFAMGSYLPFLELGLRSTYPLQFKEHAIGDRMPIVRIKIFSEKEFWPSVLVGFHDFLSAYGGNSAVHFNSLYLVMTKNFYNGMIGTTVGYGSDIMKADAHQFVGIFGGINIRILKNFEVMAEYDGTHTNGGLRVKLFDHISLLGGWLRWKYFSGGAGVSFGL